MEGIWGFITSQKSVFRFLNQKQNLNRQKKHCSSPHRTVGRPSRQRPSSNFYSTVQYSSPHNFVTN